MPISSVTTDYSSRTKDIHILQGANGRISTRHTVTPSFGKVSSYCAGVQKLIQRYLISFFNAVGSQPDFPEFGTNFMRKMASSRRSITKAEISHLFNFANANVISAFRTYQAENPGLPLDEQINRAELENATASADTLLLDIKITTLAGEAISFVLPLPDTL